MREVFLMTYRRFFIGLIVAGVAFVAIVVRAASLLP